MKAPRPSMSSDGWSRCRCCWSRSSTPSSTSATGRPADRRSAGAVQLPHARGASPSAARRCAPSAAPRGTRSRPRARRRDLRPGAGHRRHDAAPPACPPRRRPRPARPPEAPIGDTGRARRRAVPPASPGRCRRARARRRPASAATTAPARACPRPCPSPARPADPHRAAGPELPDRRRARPASPTAPVPARRPRRRRRRATPEPTVGRAGDDGDARSDGDAGRRRSARADRARADGPRRSRRRRPAPPPPEAPVPPEEPPAEPDGSAGPPRRTRPRRRIAAVKPPRTSMPAPDLRRTARPAAAWTLVAVELQDGQERLLGHLDAADLLHALLALLLALEQLALARDVTAVALGGHVLAERLHRLAGDDLRADRGLDRHVVLLARDLLAQPLDQRRGRLVGLVPVHDHRQRVDGVAGEQHVELDQVGGRQPISS